MFDEELLNFNALSAKRRQTDPKLVKRLRASQKQHAINQKIKATEKLDDEEGAPVARDLWESDEEDVKNKNSEDEDDDDPMAFHNKITKVGYSVQMI